MRDVGVMFAFTREITLPEFSDLTAVSQKDVAVDITLYKYIKPCEKLPL